MLVSDIANGAVSKNLQTLVTLFGDDNTTEADETPPYFDAVDSDRTGPSPIVDQILQSLELDDGDSLSDWIRGYVLVLRPVIRRMGNGSVLLVQHYEQVLSRWCQVAANPLSIPVEKRESVLDTLQQISQDLGFISNIHLQIEISDYSRRNTLVPTLMQIMTRCFGLLRETTQESMNVPRNMDWYQTIVADILAFQSTESTPMFLASDLGTLTLLQDIDDILLSPEDFDFQKVLDLNPHSVDWPSLQLDVYHVYFDRETTIATRAANRLWHSLSKVVVANKTNAVVLPGDLPEERSAEAIDVIRALGIPAIAKDLHTRFFAKCNRPNEVISNEVQLYKGRLVDPSRTRAFELGYIAEPSRVLAFLHFLQLLETKDKVDIAAVASLLIAMCLELLDSTNKKYAAMGAASLIRLTILLDENDEALIASRDKIMAGLQSAFTAHTEDGAVFVIGRAQYLLARLFGLRRVATQHLCKQWLLRLQRNSHNVTESSTTICLLSGGVLPLLTMLAHQEAGSGIEIAKAGLSSILPLVVHDYIAQETRSAALLALLILMIAAYPVMPHHGGKIICHLLTLMDEARGTATESLAFDRMILHATAVCLVVCGNTARDILIKIKSEKGKYKPRVLEQISEAEKLADALAVVKTPKKRRKNTDFVD